MSHPIPGKLYFVMNSRKDFVTTVPYMFIKMTTQDEKTLYWVLYMHFFKKKPEIGLWEEKPDQKLVWIPAP